MAVTTTRRREDRCRRSLAKMSLTLSKASGTWPALPDGVIRLRKGKVIGYQITDGGVFGHVVGRFYSLDDLERETARLNSEVAA
jgi:hypothetical protein